MVGSWRRRPGRIAPRWQRWLAAERLVRWAGGVRSARERPHAASGASDRLPGRDRSCRSSRVPPRRAPSWPSSRSRPPLVSRCLPRGGFGARRCPTTPGGRSRSDRSPGALADPSSRLHWLRRPRRRHRLGGRSPTPPRERRESSDPHYWWLRDSSRWCNRWRTINSPPAGPPPNKRMQLTSHRVFARGMVGFLRRVLGAQRYTVAAVSGS
jgi:hypothetical protein